LILIPVIGVLVAITLDLFFGDIKNKYHPTVWVGKLIARFVPFARSNNPVIEKINGIILLISVIGLVSFLVIFFSSLLKYLDIITLNEFDNILPFCVSVVAVGTLLKCTIAIKGLEEHASKIMIALSNNDLEDAREKLSMIVKRSTKNLDKQHIISATLESISENIVDGITGPFFYFSIFGLTGALVYRTVNTADSMIGYKTEIFRNIGWFSATFDKIQNFLPSRLTSLVMVLSCFLLRENWRLSIKVMKRDGSQTESLNAGYPMATMAGALGIRFEKLGYYSLGDDNSELSETHFRSAVSIMKVTTFLFVFLFTLPMVLFLSNLGWWYYV
jgi:adenosylcobinamide-phosphate synthase